MTNEKWRVFGRIIKVHAIVLLLGAAPLASCSLVRPVRTLPSWVRGIYVPMVQNKSAEPGLEEIVTRRIQEEFLSDGRVRIVQKHAADLQLVVTIKAYGKDYTPFGRRGRGSGFGGSGFGGSYNSDRIPSSERLFIETELMLYDPAVDPFDPKEAPVATLDPIITEFTYPSDLRSTTAMIEPDVKTEAMSLLARQVVYQTIEGFPTALRNESTGLSAPAQPLGPTQMNSPGNAGALPQRGSLNLQN